MDTIAIRDRRQADWFWIDNIIVDQYLSIIGTDAYAVYNVLVRHADNKTQTSYPKHDRIAELCRLSKPTVIKCIDILEAVELVKQTERYAEVHYASGATGERQTSNLYTLLPVRTHISEDLGKSFTNK